MIPGGAYEPPKAVGEHETQFQANPNYVTTFENLILSTSCAYKSN